MTPSGPAPEALPGAWDRPDGDTAAHFERLVRRRRRDVHGFRPRALEPGAFDRVLARAALAPSVGLSQPWR